MYLRDIILYTQGSEYIILEGAKSMLNNKLTYMYLYGDNFG